MRALHTRANDIRENNGVVVFFVPSPEHERNTLSRGPSRELIDELRVFAELAFVSPSKLDPFLGVVLEPTPQLRRGRELFHPVVNREPPLAQPSRPQAVDKDASAIRRLRPFIRAL